MCSSEDETEFFVKSQINSQVSSSQKASVVKYFFVITFNWDLMVGTPFESNVCELFKNEDFPEEWITGPLSQCNRKEKRRVISLDGGVYSLFCKVEKGTIIAIAVTVNVKF